MDQILHDLKKIADTMRILTEALDNLYNDLVVQGAVPDMDTKIVNIKDYIDDRIKEGR